MSEYTDKMLFEAETEILRLRAENEKLRAALKPFSQYTFEKYDGSDPAILELVSDLRAAAAAMKETDNG